VYFEGLEFAGSFRFEDDYGDTVRIIQYVMWIGILLVVLLACATKSHALSVGSDTSSPSGLVFFTLFVWDFYSDCFFVLRLALENAWPCFAVGALFTVVPYIMNLYELHKWEKKWLRDLTIKQGLESYLDKYHIWLVFCSLISGSSFATIEMVNTNMFGWRFFSMGLTDRHLKRYNTRRLYSNILTENIPQLGVQIWYTFQYSKVGRDGWGAVDDVVIYAFMSSMVSILVSIIDVYSSRELIKTMKDANMYYQEEDAEGTSKVTSNKTFYICVESIEIEERRQVLLQRTRPIQEAIGEVIEVHSRVINLQQFVPKYDGVRIAFTVFSVKIEKQLITERLCEAMSDGTLAERVQLAWKLLYMPEVTQIETLVGTRICPIRPDGTVVDPETGEAIIEGDLAVDEFGRALSMSQIDKPGVTITDADDESAESSESDGGVFAIQRRFSAMLGLGKKPRAETVTTGTSLGLPTVGEHKAPAGGGGAPAAGGLAPPPPSQERASFVKRMSGVFGLGGGAGGRAPAMSPMQQLEMQQMQAQSQMRVTGPPLSPVSGQIDPRLFAAATGGPPPAPGPSSMGGPPPFGGSPPTSAPGSFRGAPMMAGPMMGAVPIAPSQMAMMMDLPESTRHFAGVGPVGAAAPPFGGGGGGRFAPMGAVPPMGPAAGVPVPVVSVAPPFVARPDTLAEDDESSFESEYETDSDSETVEDELYRDFDDKGSAL
jgi:uncharacterized protein YaaQ